MVCFVLGAFSCIRATLPIQFWTVGNVPSSWYDDIQSNTPLVELLGQQADFYDQEIKDNGTAMARNARYIRTGTLLGILAPAIGALAAGTVYFAVC